MPDEEFPADLVNCALDAIHGFFISLSFGEGWGEALPCQAVAFSDH